VSDSQARQIMGLKKDLKELSELFVKNDQELRGKLRDIRIANMAGVTATEFTLATRLGITMDVVLSLLPEANRAIIEKEIDRRVAKLPDTTDVAKTIAADQYNKDNDY